MKYWSKCCVVHAPTPQGHCSGLRVFFPVSLQAVGQRGSVEKELIRDLLTQYEYEGKLGRPVIQATDMVMVNFSLSLIQILDVDEKNQILKTNIWYHYKWRDIFLQWTPEKHDNITSIRVPSDKIWLPDILLYNFNKRHDKLRPWNRRHDKLRPRNRRHDKLRPSNRRHDKLSNRRDVKVVRIKPAPLSDTRRLAGRESRRADD
ncbi:neuronal acetylcholine receptor subunit alpha-7 [Elysia marginata]|uniref:Neuronal acetylcholine receptor subunit alpha-7 n=1 Tax=Elysia marginata TaxID=1093978 RepID=A0AAV4IHN6_9GAST|nr:neuronal acetylcholine receptor subunit alpha-7 [Elysia marginata]